MMRSGMLVLLLVVVCVGAGVGDGVSLKRDKENVVASELEGSWRLNSDLSSRLWGSDKSKRTDVITFRSDPAVAALVPQELAEFLAGNEIFMAGFVTLRDREHHFLLTSVHGNPYVIWAEVEERGPFSNVESWNVMLAKGNGDADLLFIGGDFNNQPFVAYERVPSDGGQPGEPVASEPAGSGGIRISATRVDEPETTAEPERQMFGFMEMEGGLLVTGFVSRAVEGVTGDQVRFVNWNVVEVQKGSPRPGGSGFKVVHMDPARTLDGEAIHTTRATIRPRDGLHWGDVGRPQDVLVKLFPAK